MAPVQGSEDNLHWFSLLFCGFQGYILGCQVWQQVPLPAKQSHWRLGGGGVKLFKRTLPFKELYLHPPMAGYICGYDSGGISQKELDKRYQEPKFPGVGSDMDDGTSKGLIVEVLEELHLRITYPVTLRAEALLFKKKQNTHDLQRDCVQLAYCEWLGNLPLAFAFSCRGSIYRHPRLLGLLGSLRALVQFRAPPQCFENRWVRIGSNQHD